MPELKLILVDPNPWLCAAFRHYFTGLPNVEIVPGFFEDLATFDCMVSPANSFGLMDGGVDAAIVRFFGNQLMDRVQQRILDDYLGEQPVGTCLLVESHHPEHPFVAHTPTMRVPLDITGTDNVYRAMWAMLLAVRKHNRTVARRINSVACPGLGTGTGRVPYPEAARQMALAYRNFLNPPRFLDWRLAASRQDQVGCGGNPEMSLPPHVVLPGEPEGGTSTAPATAVDRGRYPGYPRAPGVASGHGG
jgi:O-acetyl-ADP-ribose deacetylase (regulator of RNase III)